MEIESNNYKKVFMRIGIALAVSVLISIVFRQFLKLAIIPRVPTLDNQTFKTLMGSYIIYFFSIPAFYLIVRKVPVHKGEATEEFSFKELLGLLSVCFATMYTLNFAGIILNGILGLVIGKSVGSPLDNMVGDLNPVLLFLTTVIIAPIVEEIVFRKIILDRLRIYGDKIAILFTALAFGLYHGNVSQFLYSFGFGLILGYMVIKTNKLKYSIIFHMIVNLMGTVSILTMNSVTQKISEGISGTVHLTYGTLIWTLITVVTIILITILGMTLLISGVVVFAKNYKKVTLEKSKLQISESDMNKAAFLNVGFLLFVAASIGKFIVFIIESN